MEIDFMGLAIKQDTSDEIIHATPVRSSLAMQWSFSNKGVAVPQLLYFKASQEEKPKTGFDSLASTGSVSITTSDPSDPEHKFSPKNVASEKQGGVRYSVINHNVHRSIANLTSPAAMPSNNSPVVGTTDLRSGPKIAAGPAQLTIFYNGSVCVYDNISPEKAQAIMLLAGKWPLVNSTATPPAAPVQVPMPPKSSVFDGFVVSQPYVSTPHGSSTIPIASIGISQFAARPATTNNNRTAVKPTSVLESSAAIDEPLKVVSSLGSTSGTFLSSGAVPQFRRKSLARFLEKRKERLISATPYADKQSTEAGGTSLSMNSSGSCPVPAIN